MGPAFAARLHACRLQPPADFAVEPGQVSCADELEQHAGLGLVLGDIGEIVEDQEVEAIEPIDGGLEIELATRDLELLDEVGGAGEEHAPSVLDQGEADGGREMALSAAGRAEQEQIGSCEQLDQVSNAHLIKGTPAAC